MTLREIFACPYLADNSPRTRGENWQMLVATSSNAIISPFIELHGIQ
jgi:hypothetical protein